MTDLMVEESLDEGHAVADGGNALSCRERQVPMMAILCLKFQERVLQEVILTGGVATIGRQPDNLLRIGNPIVSGHHAKVYWDGSKYILQDIESFNGTYVNNRRIGKRSLEDGDVILIGKHTLQFRLVPREEAFTQSGRTESSTSDRSAHWQSQLDKNRAPQLDCTMMLDTKRIRKLLGKNTKENASSQQTVQTLGISSLSSERVHVTSQRRMGVLTVTSGRTNAQRHVLSSKLSVIGKSELATIRLRRWFAPRIAASIHRREDGYILFAAGKDIKLIINDAEINRYHELRAGDIIEVAGIKARFDYDDDTGS